MFAAIGRNMSYLQVATAAFISIHQILSKNKKRREGLWWQTQLCRIRTVYSGASLLVDLKFQEICRKYRRYTRVAPADFDFLINLIGMKITKDTLQGASMTAEDRPAVFFFFFFFATGESYTNLQ
jgi:hypothetical protein